MWDKSLCKLRYWAPSETSDTVKKTIENAKAIQADDADVSILAPFPGTELYRDGRIKFKDRYWYKKHEYVSKFPWCASYNTMTLSSRELQELWLIAVREIKGGELV